MTALKTLKDAVSKAKTCILENLDHSAELTGEVNPYGDQTLLLDVKAEDEIMLTNKIGDFFLVREIAVYKPIDPAMRGIKPVLVIASIRVKFLNCSEI